MRSVYVGYTLETWSLKKVDAAQLEVFENIRLLHLMEIFLAIS